MDTLLMRMSEEDWDVVIDTNLKGTFNCIRAVSRQMMRQRSGTIVNITSVAGIAGNPGQANYASAKAGIIGLTKTVAKELGSRGITCNAVAPGFVPTDLTASLPEDLIQMGHTRHQVPRETQVQNGVEPVPRTERRGPQVEKDERNAYRGDHGR